MPRGVGSGRARAIAAIGGVLASIALTEAGLALAGLGGPERFWVAVTLADGERRVVRSTPGRPPGHDNGGFTAAKAPGSRRLFFFGASTVLGFPFARTSAFPALVGKALEGVFPETPFEVVNAADAAVPLAVAAARLGEALAHEPDLVVVLTGHNEFLGGNPAPALDRRRRPLVAAARERIESLRTVRALRRLAPRRPYWRVSLAVDEMARYTEPENKATILENYLATWKDLVARTRAAAVSLVVVIPPADRVDWAPNHSRQNPSLGRLETARFAEALARGDESLAAGDPAGALLSLREAVSLDPGHARALHRLGRALLALGKFTEARQHLERASEQDAAPMRLPPSFERALRNLCVREGVPFVDAPALFAEGSPTGIPHSTFFVDHCHSTPEGHRRIARELLRVLAEEGILFPREAWPAHAPEAGVPEPSPQERRGGDALLAELLFPGALRMEDPWLADRAIALLRPFVEEHPGPAFVLGRFYLAAILFRRGRTAEAAPHLAEALAHMREDVEFRSPALRATGLDRRRAERMLREAEASSR